MFSNRLFKSIYEDKTITAIAGFIEIYRARFLRYSQITEKFRMHPKVYTCGKQWEINLIVLNVNEKDMSQS